MNAETETRLPDPETIKVVAVDQVSSELILYRAPTADAPVIIGMPAMGVRSSFYRPLAQQFQKLGFHYACAELRGIGSSSIRASRSVNFGYQDMIALDWPAIIDTVKLHCFGSPVWLLGHSLGGQLSALYMAIQPEEVAGLILLSSCSVYYRNFPSPWRLWLATQTLWLSAELLGYMPGKRLGFGGTEARRVIRDWARNARTGLYRLENSPLDYDKLLARLRHPVLAVSLATDDYAPRAAVDHLCRKMDIADLTRWHFEDGELSSARLNHFNWVQHADLLADHVAEWVWSKSPASVTRTGSTGRAVEV